MLRAFESPADGVDMANDAVRVAIEAELDESSCGVVTWEWEGACRGEELLSCAHCSSINSRSLGQLLRAMR